MPIAHAEILPEIDAHEFQSTPLKKSLSGRVYLFHTDDRKLPKSGSILLIQADGKPAAAFRVIQVNQIKGEFVAKKVRRYDQLADLEINGSYKTVEKVADALIPPPPQQIPVDETAPKIPIGSDGTAGTPEAGGPPGPDDLDSGPDAKAKRAKKGEVEVYDYDDDLDKATSPQNLKKNMEDLDEDDASGVKTESEISEVNRLSTGKNMLGFTAGFFRNMSNFVVAGSTFNGFAVRYSHALAQDLFLNPKNAQDEISLDLGAGYYRDVNSSQTNDLYTIMPLSAELRYDLHFSETFTFLIYGGIQYNMMASSENSVKSTADKIMGPQQTIGFGFMFNMGPHWYIRIDIGWDRVMGGLALRW